MLVLFYQELAGLKHSYISVTIVSPSRDLEFRVIILLGLASDRWLWTQTGVCYQWGPLTTADNSPKCQVAT